MNTVKLWLAKVPLLLFAVVLAGCAHGGVDFNYAATARLEPGRSPSSQCKKLIGGEPLQQMAVTNGNGRFELLRYLYVNAALGSAKVHTAILEFKNDLLNAFVRASNVEGAMLEFHPDRVQQLKVGLSTKDEVRRILGTAHGSGLCPTLMKDYARGCARGVEVWSWMAIAQLASFDTAENGLLVDIRAIYVAFDANGVVSEVQVLDGDEKR